MRIGSGRVATKGRYPVGTEVRVEGYLPAGLQHPRRRQARGWIGQIRMGLLEHVVEGGEATVLVAVGKGDHLASRFLLPQGSVGIHEVASFRGDGSA